MLIPGGAQPPSLLCIPAQQAPEGAMDHVEKGWIGRVPNLQVAHHRGASRSASAIGDGSRGDGPRRFIPHWRSKGLGRAALPSAWWPARSIEGIPLALADRHNVLLKARTPQVRAMSWLIRKPFTLYGLSREGRPFTVGSARRRDLHAMRSISGALVPRSLFHLDIQ